MPLREHSERVSPRDCSQADVVMQLAAHTVNYHAIGTMLKADMLQCAAIGWTKVQRMHDSSDGRDDLDPVSFHFCNVIGHAVVTCLIYFLAVRLCCIRDSLAQAAKAASPAAQKQLQPEGGMSDGSDRQALLADAYIHCMIALCAAANVHQQDSAQTCLQKNMPNRLLCLCSMSGIPPYPHARHQAHDTQG